MGELFTMGNLITFLLLTLLQAVLGFDNLLYISIESGRVEASKQSMVRKLGIGLAIVFRLILLFAILHAIEYFRDPFYETTIEGVFHCSISVHALIVVFGGAFILYTAVKEIVHLLGDDDLEADGDGAKRSAGVAIAWIVLMNLVFSFDSILSAIALTNEFWVMAAAVIVSGILMITLADRVSGFLERNRMFQVLGLFILFIVGVMLVSEGGHLAHLKFFDYEVHPMTKTTFYFVLAVLIVVDLVQARYQRVLNKRKASRKAKLAADV